MSKVDKERIAVYLKTALQVLQENGGQLASREVVREVEKRLNLSDYEKARFEKTGYIRWESILHFYSIDLTKAGWLIKKKGIWYLTPEGAENLKLPPRDFITLANKKYREWKQSQPVPVDDLAEISEDEDKQRPSAYEQAVGLAREEIRNYIDKLDPYSFQDLVAALLRAMGYHTPFVAPRGRPDGGVDILAYRDPFGTESPRIKVQVKHRNPKVSAPEIRQLLGLLTKEGDTGLFVSTSGYTEEAINAIRSAPKHVEKLDLDALIDLWEKYFDKMEEEDQALLPLRRIAFLAPAG